MFTGALTADEEARTGARRRLGGFRDAGPPRLSKLLYEAYLLKTCFGDIRTVARTEGKILSRRLFDLLESDDNLRSHVISIGIPILLPDGKSLVRGSHHKDSPLSREE